MTSLSAAYVREVRLLRKAREITDAQMRLMLGLPPVSAPPQELPGMTDADRENVHKTVAEWRRAHP
jgi:hypothetical protein